MSTDKNQRLLKAVKTRYPELSLRQIREFIAAGRVLVNGKLAKERSMASPDDDIALTGTRRNALKPNSDVDCRPLIRTDDFLFLNKGKGVHSVAHDFEEENSVANWLLSVEPSLTNLGPLECGLAHRLDFETSGVMVAALNRAALEHVRNCFRQRTVVKEYVCLVTSEPPEPGVHEAFAGKHPKSDKRVRVESRGTEKTAILTEILRTKRQGDFWRVTLKLITGYRHQIRAHLAFLGCPIAGDVIYGGAEADRVMLHAERIAFLDLRENLLEATSPAPF